MDNLNKKVAKATKWSGITELVAKLITPVSSMVLARLLTPEAFGVVTTLTMIITFAELFTDAGFQKYLVQHEFKDKDDLYRSTNVAFWSNFLLSVFIWLVIIVFADPLATLVGNPGLGYVLIIACVSIPLEAFSSIQMALFRRNLDFKTLFKVRLVSILIPIVVTIPLAIWLRSYWALVGGTIAQNLVNAFLLTLFSKWKPGIYFSFAKLKEMLSFTLWTLLEEVSIWLTSYIDIFIVGTMLSQHYLGLYKTASALVGQIMGLVTAATAPVLFSSLSRLQNNDNEFNNLFFKFQKIVGLLIMPLGVGIFCFRDLLTKLALGSQWLEASYFIGLWALSSTITIVFSHYSSEVYRAKGLPKLSVLAQILHIVVLWPVVAYTVKYGFDILCLARSLVRIELILVNLVIIYYIIHISPLHMFKNVFPSIVASLTMLIVGDCLMYVFDSIAWQIVLVLLCTLVYLLIVCIFKDERILIKKYLFRK